MSAAEKYTSAHSFGAPWKPVERAAYNRSLQSYFDNCRSVNVHDDWSVAKSREECQPFTYSFHDPNSSSNGRDGKRWRTFRPADNIKAQEKFTKQLGILERKIAREHKARDKRAA